MEHREKAIQALYRLIEFNAPRFNAPLTVAEQDRKLVAEIVDELSAAAMDELDRRMQCMVERARVAGIVQDLSCGL